MINNKLYKIFGPFSSGIGIVVIIIGIMTLFENVLIGIIIILIGIFVGFSYTSTVVDINKKRIRFLNNLFGLIPVGKWVDIKSDMKIGLKRNNKRWRIYSRSNRKFDLYEKDYLLILYDYNDKVIMPVKKNDNLECAKSEGVGIAEQFGINIK
ncbi:MAG: hypothetical protein LBQ22_03050 [Bacteroidales bacterium]|jgi:hypothetical protein|nr:hypothetical protein [Bacteroidales bacterium]